MKGVAAGLLQMLLHAAISELRSTHGCTGSRYSVVKKHFRADLVLIAITIVSEGAGIFLMAGAYSQRLWMKVLSSVIEQVLLYLPCNITCSHT